MERFKKILPLIILLGLLVSSCMPKGKEETVEVKTAGIFEPVTFKIIGGVDLGEILTGSDPVFVTIQVTNNSKFSLTDMNLIIDVSQFSDAGMTFALTESGVDAYPGSGGTCGATLAALSSCNIVVMYNPIRSGEFKQKITFSYKNFVKQEKIEKVLKMLTGEAASLIAIDIPSNNFNYGIIEQTEPVLKFQNLRIENRGGISARNLELTLNSAQDPSAFVLESHNCPLTLKAGDGCDATVSYVPLNILETDPETDYSATLTFSYIKDGATALSNLNLSFAFKSTKIQANFDANLAVVEFPADTVVGNKEAKNIRVINKGYREGILKEIIIKDAGGVVKGICVKAAVGNILDCNDEITGLPVSLAQLPFKLLDIDGCMEAEAQGAVNGVPGEACDFNITFQPSITYTTDIDFTGWTIDYKYDSRWKGLETILVEKIFDVAANSLAAAKLEFQFFTFGTSTLTDQNPSEFIAHHDIGRAALINNEAYFTPFEIRVKNVGSVPAIISGKYDGQSPAKNIPSIAANIMSSSDVGLKTYYHQVTTSCDIIDVNQTCSIVGRFAPKFWGDEALQARLFTDVNQTGPADLTRYKQFFLQYKDGSVFEDDGSARPDRIIEQRISGILIQKGYLVYQNTDPAAGNMGNIVAGLFKDHQIILENVGTGTIPYLKIDDTNNLKMFGTIPNFWAFTVIPSAPPPGVTFDCYNILDWENQYLDSPFPPKGGIAPLETCSLTVRTQLANYDRKNSWDYQTPASDEIRRANYSAFNNTMDQWEYDDGQLSAQVSFQYYDGDIGLGLPLPYIDAYGFFQSIPNYDLSLEFRDKGKINPDLPMPIESAVIYRPAMNYPVIPGAPSGTDMANGWNIAPYWFTQPSVLPPGSNQSTATSYVAGIVSPADDYTYHMGTFPAIAQNFIGSFQIIRQGWKAPDVSFIGWDGPIPQLSLLSTHGPAPFTFFSSQVVQLQFSPTPGADGFYESWFRIDFDDGYQNVTRKIRVIAEAEKDYPDIVVSSQEYSVTIVAGNPVEVLDGVVTNPVTSKFMEVDTGSTDYYFAVKGSAVYAKKRYTLTNPTAFPVNNLNIMLKTAINVATFNNNQLGIEAINTTNCLSIPAFGSCSFDIKFTPPAGSASNTAKVLALSYEIKPNQFITKAVNQQFAAGDPADLKVDGQNTIQILDNSDGWIKASYPVKYGVYTDVIHIKATNYPEVVTKGTFWVRNYSVLKASFRPMLAGPPPYTYPVEIYNSGGKRVLASQGCIFGDDPEIGGIPDDEKGFNSLVTAPNRCLLTFEYAANEKYVGKDIVKEDEVIPLEFYNNKWSSTDFINFHYEGFVEPNFSTASQQYFDVTAVSTGTASFKWGAFIPQNATWGGIVGYRVFMSTTQNALNNIHTTTASFVDVPLATTSITYNGLQQGRYYYFKVVARRTKNAVTYKSEDKTLPTLRVVIPPAGSIYVHGLGAIIDKTYQPSFGNKALGVSTCGSKVYNLMNGGLPVNKTKKLITTPIWDFLRADIDQVSFSTYSAYVLPAVPHWLGDNPTDIAPIFAPFGFDSANTSMYVPPPDNLLYQKPCTDATCNSLDKIKGGDGSEIPYDATLYLKGDSGGAVFRCWANI